MSHVYLNDHLTFAGYASPEAALESYCSAFFRADKQAILQSVAPDLHKLVADKTEEQIKAGVQRESMKGYIIKSREDVSDDMVLLHISGVEREVEAKCILKRIGAEWKLADIKVD